MSYPKEGGLNAHRQLLTENENWNLTDQDCTVDKWIGEAWSYIREVSTISKKLATPILRKMALMVWNAQAGLPLFHFESKKGLPMSWNRPQDGGLNYIRYEIGHMTPSLSGGISHPNNLSFQSARCNQHIQSSLDMDEVLSYFESVPEVLKRIENIKKLHQSSEWIDCLTQLGV